MNKKILILSSICLSVILLASTAQVQGQSRIVAWTDKTEYLPGQTGKLYVTYNNDRDNPVTIRNITVIFDEWTAYINGEWLGNLTYMPADSEKTVTERTTRTFEIHFTVPSDGRAKTTTVDITVNTNEPVPDSKSNWAGIYVVDIPVYMEQIVTLFTIQVVLIIICTIIIAATIFLSMRKPSTETAWTKEEKTE